MGKIVILFSITLLILAVGINAYSQEPPPPSAQGQMQPGELKSENSTSNNIETKRNDDKSHNPISTINTTIAQSGNACTKNSDEKKGNEQGGTINDGRIIIIFNLLLVIFTGLLVFLQSSFVVLYKEIR